MSRSIEEAFAEFHNLHVREALRRFPAMLVLVAVNDHDSIVKTQKLKELKVDDLHNFGDDCKGTAIFIANTDSLKTLDEFRQAVRQSGESIRKRRAGITDDPDRFIRFKNALACRPPHPGNRNRCHTNQNRGEARVLRIGIPVPLL